MCHICFLLNICNLHYSPSQSIILLSLIVNFFSLTQDKPRGGKYDSSLTTKLLILIQMNSDMVTRTSLSTRM